MFSETFEKLNTFAHHHQAIIAVIVTFCFICVSWGIENILDKYVFHKRTFHGYLILIAVGLLILWLVQHYILHAV